MIVNLPWFPADCRPNARSHWAKVAEAKKRYRTACWALTKESVGNPQLPDEGEIHLVIEFFPPSRRAYDLDNCLAAFKAGLDGIADALRVNDKKVYINNCNPPRSSWDGARNHRYERK